MKVTKKVEIGISAVSTLKSKVGRANAVELAVAAGTTRHFIEQVLNNLRKAKIVSSVKGPGGGYRLEKLRVTAEDIALAVGEKFGTENQVLDGDLRLTLKLYIQNAYRNTMICG
jgi:Rrf2 family iron-sulfur cluster assembly transcriptional regulator